MQLEFTMHMQKATRARAQTGRKCRKLYHVTVRSAKYMSGTLGKGGMSLPQLRKRIRHTRRIEHNHRQRLYALEELFTEALFCISLPGSGATAAAAAAAAAIGATSTAFGARGGCRELGDFPRAWRGQRMRRHLRHQLWKRRRAGCLLDFRGGGSLSLA